MGHIEYGSRRVRVDGHDALRRAHARRKLHRAGYAERQDEPRLDRAPREADLPPRVHPARLDERARTGELRAEQRRKLLRHGQIGAVPEAAEDSTSLKGIKAGGDLTITGGAFSMDTADDAVHSNANITVSGGTFSIASGDDGFHADDTLTVNDGVIDISKSYEGLEGLHVLVSGGKVSLVASDDGINAAGGMDSSGTGGVRGGDRFGGMGRPGGMMGGASNGSILISGGDLYVQASGDGIDANGTLEITGGHTIVCGPTQGDTATLDYDVSGVISGGTFIGTGGSGMAQSFSKAEQGLIAVRAGSIAAGTAIVLTDSSGKVLLSHSPALNYAVVILSCPEMVSGSDYTLTIGDQSQTITAQ